MTYLITGATGQVGRAIVDQMLAAGEPVRALTRSPQQSRLPEDAEVVAGDLGDPATLTGAFDDVSAMFMFPVFGPEPQIAAMAKAAGVSRIVTLSTDAVTEGVDTGAHRMVEQAAEDSGLEWTHIRPGEFAGNKRELWAASIRAEGVVRTAYPDVTGAPTHEADIAAVAVAALREPGHHGKVYQPLGPHATHRKQIEAIGAAIGREIRVEVVSHSRERHGYIEAGLPAWAVDHIMSYFPRWIDEPPAPRGDVEAVTGRPARDFAQWARDHAADFQ